MYLIDANIFLELQLDQERADECENLLLAVQRGKINALLTDLVLDSILIVMEDKGKHPSDLETFLMSLSSLKGLRIYVLTLLDRLEATRIMRECHLEFEDSTLVRTARKLRVDRVISFDRHFDKAEGISRVEPADIVNSLNT